MEVATSPPWHCALSAQPRPDHPIANGRLNALSHLAGEMRGLLRLLVDTLGLVMAIKVHEADEQDRARTILLLRDLPNVFPRMQHVWADAGYTGKLASDIKSYLGWTLEIVKQPWSGWQGTWAPKDAPPRLVEVPRSFVVPRHRWMVGRTFAWLGKSRRMAKDYEALVETSENLVYEVMIRLIFRRLAKSTP